MPDTSYTNIQNRIDSLVSKTDVVLQYVNEQEKMTELRPSIWWIIGGILFFVIIIKIILIKNKGNKKVKKVLNSLGIEYDDDHKNDKRRSYIELLIWLLVVSVLFAFGLIHNKFSQAELLFTVALIFTIVGAFWSVFSRIESTKAFKQSEKTFNALGSTFDFISFFDNDKLPEVYKIIGSKDTSEDTVVSLYIGFPIVGLPYVKNKKLIDTIDSLFTELIRHIEDIKEDKIKCTLNIGVFSETDSEDTLEKVPNIEPEKKLKLQKKLTKFYGLLKGADNDKIRVIYIDFKEKFRFVTRKEKGSVDKTSFIWIVDLEGREQFDSVVFQTKEIRFLNLLEDVF